MKIYIKVIIMEQFVEKHKKVIDKIFCGLYGKIKSKKIFDRKNRIARKQLVTTFPNLFPYFHHFHDQEEAIFRL
jgi:hypothetical protein